MSDVNPSNLPLPKTVERPARRKPAPQAWSDWERLVSMPDLLNKALDFIDAQEQTYTPRVWKALVFRMGERAIIHHEPQSLRHLLLGTDVPVGSFLGRDSLLLQAAHYGERAMMEDLVHQGANINERNAHGSTALHLVAKNGNWDDLAWLVEQGAEAWAKDNDGMTPWDYWTPSRDDAPDLTEHRLHWLEQMGLNQTLRAAPSSRRHRL